MAVCHDISTLRFVLITVQCCTNYVFTPHLTNGFSVSVERGLFPWSGVLLKEERQVATCHCSYDLGYSKDNSKWLGKMLRIWKRGIRGRGQGFDFNHQHHNNRWANKTQKDFTPRLILTEFFSVSSSPRRALLIYHLLLRELLLLQPIVSLFSQEYRLCKKDKWMTISHRVVEEIALVYVITLKNIFDFFIFHDKIFKLHIYIIIYDFCALNSTVY